MPLPITTKKWRATRPTSCKASGVGEACDKYADFCLPVTQLTTDDAIAKARDTVLALQMALRDAKAKIKPKDKEKAATEELIEDWLKQIKLYQTEIAAIVKQQSDDDKAEYAKVLRRFGEAREDLLKYFEDAAGKFDAIIDEVKSWVAKADALAKGAAAQPAKATQIIAALEQLREKARPIQGKLDAANAEALKKFDPFRSATGPESASTLGVLPKDAAPYSGVFTKTDNLRKQMIEQAKSMKGYEDSIAASLEEARVTTLPESEKLPAYIKLATDLQANVRALTDRISNKGVGAKGILDGGEDYKDKFDSLFVNSVRVAPPNEKDQIRKLARSRATQRYDQVKEIEEGLKAAFVNAGELLKRGISGIPKNLQASPEIKAQTDGAMTAFRDARAYLDRFVQARTDAEQPYLDALKAIDEA